MRFVLHLVLNDETKCSEAERTDVGIQSMIGGRYMVHGAGYRVGWGKVGNIGQSESKGKARQDWSE